MGQSTPPPPHDERWTAPAINLLRAVVLLDMSYDVARTWATGSTRTAMGATVVTSQPVVPSLQGQGRDIDLPLMGVAGIILLHALVSAGADPQVLVKVMLALQDQHGVTPLAATQQMESILPGALEAAAADRAEPSLMTPLVPDGDGWTFGPVVRRALEDLDHDDDGWVRAARLAGGAVVVRAGSTAVPPLDGADAVVVAKSMFLDGRSLVQIAAVLDCEVSDVEAALRLQV